MAGYGDAERPFGNGEMRGAPTGDPWLPAQATDLTRRPPGEVVLAGYRDFELLASSEGSRVYRARQDGLDRPVAVKILLLDDPAALTRFHREIEITVRLGRQHPHIVTVIDTGTTADGRPCIVMEYYDGGSLYDRLRAHGPLTVGEVLAAGTVIADALSFAHGQGVLHRDVKPQNILMLPTSYVVADFGIARRIDAGHTASVEWFSFRHAAPQVLDGVPNEVADDIWSLGSTLYTLLDGRPPFASDVPGEDSSLAYMRRVRTSAPRPLTRTDVPDGLARIISRCLQRERADRFHDAAALHEALLAVTAEERAWAPSRPQAVPPPAPAARPRPLDVPLAAPPPRASAAPPRAPAVPPPAGAEPPTAARPPAEMSPAALAHIVASAVAAGGYAVGEETTGVHDVKPPQPGADQPADRPRSSAGRKPVLVGATIALVLLLGGAVGFAGTWIAGGAGDSPTSGAARPTGAVSTAAVEPSVTRPAGTTNRPNPTPSNVNNLRIAPTITGLDVRGGKVVLRWRDPTQGNAVFVVVKVTNGRGDTVREVAAGTTEVVLDETEAGTAPYCFLLIAFVGVERGVSPTRCAETQQ
jgi:eukaryotic-like serine/threonine-protein kinase